MVLYTIGERSDNEILLGALDRSDIVLSGIKGSVDSSSLT